MIEQKQEPLPYEYLRPFASRGPQGLLGAAFPEDYLREHSEALKAAFMKHYLLNLCVETKLFDGMWDLLDSLENQGLPWGIVTNKIAHFTLPLVHALGLSERAACVVSGDTTPHPKPHPEPLLYAAKQINVPPEHIAFVGDDLRDIQAGQAAGMLTVGVTYGYGYHIPPVDWDADILIKTPEALLSLFKNAGTGLNYAPQ